MSETFALMQEHQALWTRFETQLNKNKVANAYLLSGALHRALDRLADRMIADLFCQTETQTDTKTKILPCGQCQSCSLVAKHEHPDYQLIQPEKTHGIIKIDQIRQASARLHTSSQLSKGHGVVVYPADKMNSNAYNALLKILEEPPANTYFLLVAENISSIPATIISRCQRLTLQSPPQLDSTYMAEGRAYAPDSSRGKAFAMLDSLMENLLDLQAKKMKAPELANRFTTIELPDLAWLLTLLHSEMIQVFFQANESAVATAIQDSPINLLAKSLKPPKLYAQLDKLYQLAKIRGNITSINARLWFEGFLLAYE